jgi:hypothetical protein
MLYSKRRSELRKKERLIHDQYGLCYWCENSKGSLVLHWDKSKFSRLPGRFATFDELLPRSRGGTRSSENQVIAHRSCNNERGNTIATKKKEFPSPAGINWLALNDNDAYERYLEDKRNGFRIHSGTFSCVGTGDQAGDAHRPVSDSKRVPGESG